MPLREMRRYAALRGGGEATFGERRRLLEAHREKVRAEVAELRSCLAVLDSKIAGYAPAPERSLDHDAADGRKRRRSLRARRESLGAH
jgi:hypothetical protein